MCRLTGRLVGDYDQYSVLALTRPVVQHGEVTSRVIVRALAVRIVGCQSVCLDGWLPRWFVGLIVRHFSV